nr:tetratricopeptide repeat protein [uncultured Noviherbaspirillum sp.]
MSPTTENVLRTACAMLDRGESTNAAVLLQDLIGSHPACAAALQMLGLIRAMHGDMRTAVRLLRQACVVEPENGSLRRHLARVEWEIGMPAQAAASYEQAIACDQASPDMRVDYAVALQALKQYQAAIAQCEQAIAIDPLHARAWSTMGNLHHTKKNLTEALACHERATSLAPGARAWSAMAVTLHAMGRLVPALACHDKALACDAADAAVWTHRGVTLGKLGQHNEALECQVEATRLDPAFACAWSNMGSMLALLQRVDEALAAHDRAISLAPSSAALWLQRGIALMKLKRGAGALASLNTAIRLDPTSSAAWCCRAEVLRSERRLPEALESLEEAVSLDPANELAVMLRIEVLHLLQRREEALALLEQAALAEPGNHRLRFATGLAQLASGNFTDGRKNVQSYRHIEESPAPPHTALPTWTGDQRRGAA